MAVLRLRERLRPYIQQQMAWRRETGLPPMRALFLEFPARPSAWDPETSTYSAPTCWSPRSWSQAPAREVYLPAGATWIEARDRGHRRGGTIIGFRFPLSASPSSYHEGAEVLDVVR